MFDMGYIYCENISVLLSGVGEGRHTRDIMARSRGIFSLQAVMRLSLNYQCDASKICNIQVDPRAKRRTAYKSNNNFNRSSTFVRNTFDSFYSE